MLHTATSALAERTHERFHAVHALLNEGAGLLECARRLGWALNTVKRYARADSAQELLRPPQYGRCLVDGYRDLVQQRLAEQVPVTRILAEIRQHGYTGSHNLLVRYINQGRADPGRVTPSPRRLVSWLMSKPQNLPALHSFADGLNNDHDAVVAGLTSPTATVPPKASSPRSNQPSVKRTVEAGSPCCARESCSWTDHLQLPTAPLITKL